VIALKRKRAVSFLFPKEFTMFLRLVSTLCVFTLVSCSHEEASAHSDAPKTINEVKALQDTQLTKFFAQSGVHAVSTTLCSFIKLPFTTNEEFCLSVKVLTESDLNSFLVAFPGQTIEGTPIGLEVSEMATPQPGVVVAD
jgi:hypothetical protein